MSQKSPIGFYLDLNTSVNFPIIITSNLNDFTIYAQIVYKYPSFSNGYNLSSIQIYDYDGSISEPLPDISRCSNLINLAYYMSTLTLTHSTIWSNIIEDLPNVNNISIDANLSESSVDRWIHSTLISAQNFNKIGGNLTLSGSNAAPSATGSSEASILSGSYSWTVGIN